MDPFSAILLIGLFTVATVKTAGTAATDGLAQAKGQTPPSQEKWRAKEEKKRQRGEQPREDPGGLRRIWQQHTEAAAEKSAAKHDGKMRYLRKHGDDIAEGKRKQLERSARRREYLGGKLAAAGGSSWEALKAAAQKAADAKRTHDDRKTEKDAWRENAHRDEQEAHNRNDFRAGGAVDPDVPEPSSSEDEPADPQSRTDHSDGSTTDATVLPFARRDSDEGEGQAEQPAEDTQPHTTDANPTGSDSDTAAQKDGENTETANTTDPDRGTRRISLAELHRRRAREDDDRRQAEEAAQRAHEAEQAQAEREHQERMAPIQMQQHASTTDTSEGDAMSTSQSGSTEITDLTTAQMRAKESQQYAGKVTAVLSDQIASIQSAIAGMQAEAQMQESASGSLSGEGFTSRITGRFDSGAEAFNNAVAALQQQVQALQTSAEQVGAAQAEMKAAATFFGKQQGLADEIGAAKQDGGVSKRTDFYAQSGA